MIDLYVGAGLIVVLIGTWIVLRKDAKDAADADQYLKQIEADDEFIERQRRLAERANMQDAEWDESRPPDVTAPGDLAWWVRDNGKK